MTPPEHVRIAVDHGTATVAVSLLGRVGDAWRLLASDAAPAGVDPDAVAGSLVRAVHAADPSLARNGPLALLALVEIGVIVAAFAGFGRMSWAAFFVHGAILIPLAVIVGLFAGNSIF